MSACCHMATVRYRITWTSGGTTVEFCPGDLELPHTPRALQLLALKPGESIDIGGGLGRISCYRPVSDGLAVRVVDLEFGGEDVCRLVELEARFGATSDQAERLRGDLATIGTSILRGPGGHELFRIEVVGESEEFAAFGAGPNTGRNHEHARGPNSSPSPTVADERGGSR